MDKRFVFWMIVIVVVALSLGRIFPAATATMGQGSQGPVPAVEHVTFSDLNRLITEHPDQVQRLTFLNGSNQVIVERPGKQPTKVDVPDDGGKQVLIKSAADNKVPVDAKDTKKDGPSGLEIFFGILIQLLPVIFIVGLIMFFMKNAQGGVQRQLANSKAKEVQPAADRKT